MPTLLVIVPHPDDESYAFGGTIALAASAGWRVVVESATNGEKGGRHDGIAAEPASLANRRRDELRDSCRILGAELPRFWALPDGNLAAQNDQAGRVANIVRVEDVSMAAALGSDGAYGHPDHLAVYRWVTGGIELLGDNAPPLLLANFPQGLFLPQYDLCLPMLGDPPQPLRSAIGSNDPDVRLPIGSVRDQKWASISAHRTQLPGGDPAALFPGGIVGRLLNEERYTIFERRHAGAAEALLADIAAPNVAESMSFSRGPSGLTKRLQNPV